MVYMIFLKFIYYTKAFYLFDWGRTLQTYKKTWMINYKKGYLHVSILTSNCQSLGDIKKGE